MDKVIEEIIFSWGHSRRYNDYPTFIKKKFGGRVQKLSVNAGFTCPNRDGTKDIHGCAYCNNITFRPGYCKPDKSITKQIDEGIDFFSGKYPDMGFMAYFQSYSNTYGELDLLESVYREALSHSKIEGLVIGTRPDCINDEILDVIEGLAKDSFVAVEFGIESTHNKTLKRINRHHTYEESVAAVERVKKRGINVGGHLILGLPGEERVDFLNHAKRLSALPLDTLKLHQLQIVKNTIFAGVYRNEPSQFHLFSLSNYVDLVVDFLELLSPKIAIERFVNQAPSEMLIAPKWGLKNFEIVAKIEQKLKERNTWQGRLQLF